VSLVDLGRLVAGKAHLASSDREQMVLRRGVGLVAAQTGVHHGGVRRRKLAGHRRRLVVVAHQTECGLGCHKVDGRTRFTNNHVVARCAVILYRGMDVGRTPQKIVVATGALCRFQTDQARMLGG